METVTQWFGRGTKPVHVGEYRATAFKLYQSAPLCFWDGHQWMQGGEPSEFQKREWRGLAVKPKTDIKTRKPQAK